MDEICAIGKAIGQRPEKGAAIAAADFLQTNFPDRTGFSPRNVRRMHDFYKVYENDKLLLRLAMKIGWTLNVVIVEAVLARDERKWYLEQALCRGWSKTQLLNTIRSGIDFVHLRKISGENFRKFSVHDTVIGSFFNVHGFSFLRCRAWDVLLFHYINTVFRTLTRFSS